MNNKTGYFLAFFVGAAAGTTISWKLLKTKYERIADEEIASVKEVFGKIRDDTIEAVKDKLDIESPSEKFGLTDTISASEIMDNITVKDVIAQYDPSADLEAVKYESPSEDDRPYVIRPDEFGEFTGYELVTLYYFADRVLTDDDFVPVDDIDITVGRDSLDHFGEYEDGCVYVRNDVFKCDYEILVDLRCYSDIS